MLKAGTVSTSGITEFFCNLNDTSTGNFTEIPKDPGDLTFLQLSSQLDGWRLKRTFDVVLEVIKSHTGVAQGGTPLNRAGKKD